MIVSNDLIIKSIKPKSSKNQSIPKKKLDSDPWCRSITLQPLHPLQTSVNVCISCSLSACMYVYKCMYVYIYMYTYIYILVLRVQKYECWRKRCCRWWWWRRSARSSSSRSRAHSTRCWLVVRNHALSERRMWSGETCCRGRRDVARRCEWSLLVRSVLKADVCWRILTYADVCCLTDITHTILSALDVCWRLLTSADFCWRMLTYAASQTSRAPYPERLCQRLQFADICWHMLTYADVCWRMLTNADECCFTDITRAILSVFGRVFSLLTYADVCWRMLTYDASQTSRGPSWVSLQASSVRWRTLTYADVCWRMLILEGSSV